ncbi:MAG: hypothetical protein AB8B81_06655 [Halioglobus sp.]
MGDAQKYTVVTSGEIGPGRDINKAKAEFAELFKTTIEKSEHYFQGKRRVLRKDLGEKQAKAYEEALSKIGVISDLLPQQVEEVASKTSIELSVVDMKPRKTPELSVVEIEPKKTPGLSVVDIAPKSPEPSIEVAGVDRPKAANCSMICPKCKTHQEQAEACAECGVIIEKYRKIASAANSAPDGQPTFGNDEDDFAASGEPGNRNTKIIAAAAAVLTTITVAAVILL